MTGDLVLVYNVAYRGMVNACINERVETHNCENVDINDEARRFNGKQIDLLQRADLKIEIER